MLTRGFLPSMRERDHGRIINISSASGRLDQSNIVPHFAAITCAYGTSKAALNRMTVGLSHELQGTGVSANALEVEATTQPYLANAPADVDISAKEPPESPAQLVAWLAAQPATLTGQILDQYELLDRLRAEGVIPPKPAASHP
jgi:NAD(P)-dependent dehydrogenase (short-subunit alcohol dehydrogenase family)